MSWELGWVCWSVVIPADGDVEWIDWIVPARYLSIFRLCCCWNCYCREWLCGDEGPTYYPLFLFNCPTSYAYPNYQDQLATLSEV